MKPLSEEDCNIIRKAYENDKKVRGASNGFKVLIYSIFICFVNNYHIESSKKEVYVINGKAERRYIERQSAEPLFYGLFANNISEFRNSLMHVSYIKKSKRMRIILKGLFSNSYGYPKGYILDYLLWKEFFMSYTAEKIGGSGHYDRLTTQIAFLSETFKKKYYMKQHGLIGNNMDIPNKIPVYSLVAYDEHEADKFREEVVSNFDCKYSINYLNTVEFMFSEYGNMHIGIIDTPIKEMGDIITAVVENLGDVECTVMQHPLSTLKKKSFVSQRIDFVESKQKEFNYDILVSGPSTLVYDYIMAGYERPILIYVLDSDSGLCDLTVKYSNVCICYTIEDISNKLKLLLMEGKTNEHLDRSV